jgi:hypothetical protein
MTHALWRALSATRLLAACGSLLTVPSETTKGACRASTARERRQRRTHPRLEARARRGAAAKMPASARGLREWCVAPVRGFRNRLRGTTVCIGRPRHSVQAAGRASRRRRHEGHREDRDRAEHIVPQDRDGRRGQGPSADEQPDREGGAQMTRPRQAHCGDRQRHAENAADPGVGSLSVRAGPEESRDEQPDTEEHVDQKRRHPFLSGPTSLCRTSLYRDRQDRLMTTGAGKADAATRPPRP